MEDVLNTLFSNQVLAVVLPGVVFGVTVYMLFKRLISFLVTLTLLGFALVSGFAFVHHEDLAAYLRGEVSEEQVAGFKRDLVDFRDQLFSAVADLRSDLSQSQVVGPRLQEQQAQLEQIEERFHRLEEAMKAVTEVQTQEEPSERPQSP